MRAHISIWLTVMFFLTVTGCSKREDSDKAKVEDQNEAKFQERDEKKDAEFVVDAIDASYAIIEVAQLGEQRSTTPQLKGHAKKIIEGQTKVINKLKTYAEDNGISVPFSGPSKTKGSVERLYDKNGRDFDAAWLDELEGLTSRLSDDVETYYDNAKGELQTVLSNALPTLRGHKSLLAELEENALDE